MNTDSALAYEAHARAFLAARDSSTIGADIARRWARSLAPTTEVLEIGCGGGFPVTRVLAEVGLALWAIDASPTLLAEFKARFPHIPVDCARAIESACFHRQFGAVISIGLVFLLSAEEQVALIRKVSGLLGPGGRFLFTAPVETGAWADMTTGHECVSLGRDVYERVLAQARLRIVATYTDEGGNNYYDTERTPAPRSPN